MNEKDRKRLEERDTPVWGCNTINPKYCETCIFAHGEPPFADLPKKAYCLIYRKEDNRHKPDHVYYDGGLCEYYNNGNDEDV